LTPAETAALAFAACGLTGHVLAELPYVASHAAGGGGKAIENVGNVPVSAFDGRTVKRGVIVGDLLDAGADIVVLPQSGGALAGIGETGAPDLHTGAGNLGTVEIFDPVTDRWSEEASMSTPRGGLTTATGRQQRYGNETGSICYAGAGSDRIATFRS
jgi:hypothetical protein